MKRLSACNQSHVRVIQPAGIALIVAPRRQALRLQQVQKLKLSGVPFPFTVHALPPLPVVQVPAKPRRADQA